MGKELGRLKSMIRTIMLIMRSKEVRLLFHLSSIDHDYLAASRKLKKSGWEGSLHPLFDPEYYRFHYLDPSFCGNSFLHFLSTGYKRRHRPGPFFDYDVYQQSTGWHPGMGNPLKHYLVGAKQCPRPGIFFDGDWYKDKTPALRKSELDPVRHYKLYGCFEEKSPIPHFDARFYRKFSEANLVPEDALSHYLTYGLDKDTPPGPFFDPAYYRRCYHSELGSSSPLEHYLREGVYRGNYIAENIERLKGKPRISIIVPVFNPDPALLNNCIRSVLFQQYPHWQLCLADDGSSREGTRELLDYWSGLDTRIAAVFREQNGGISHATNSAAALADGEYLGFLDNDDELAPDCLYHIAQVIADELPDIIYTDEDLIGDDGRRFSVFRKAGFNRTLLYSHNYITHFVVVSKKIFASCSGFHSRYDGAQDFDFMLRASERAGTIRHIPRVLYHWRATQTSTSINHDQKGYAHEAGRQALQ
ncbi:MAG: glycosyltransferase, partial [Desulfocapsaceae bacterium]|nr:glycosyltransferase [Desulfocapsaceae bacterium]